MSNVDGVRNSSVDEGAVCGRCITAGDKSDKLLLWMTGAGGCCCMGPFDWIGTKEYGRF